MIPALLLLGLAPVIAIGPSANGTGAGSTTAKTADTSGPQWVLVDRDGFNTGTLDRKKWTPFVASGNTTDDDTYWDGKMIGFAKDPDGTKYLQLRNKMVSDSRGRTLHSAGIGGWGWVGNASTKTCSAGDYKPGTTSVCRQYGRIDVRLRMQQKYGISGVGLLWPNNDSWPPEIDFFEVGNRTLSSKKMEITNHWAEPAQRGAHAQWAEPVRDDFTKWTKVTTVWSPKRLAVYVNGVKKYQTTDSVRIPNEIMWPGFQTHFKWVEGFNLADGQSVNFDVDYIRVMRDARLS